jgi:hypothetical protein
MASIIKTLIFTSAITLPLTTVTQLQAASSRPFDTSEIPDPEALTAYKKFWDAFQDYESQKKKVAVEEYQRTRDGLETLYAGQEKSVVEKRISLLEESIKRYNDNLEKTPTATNRPYVMLSLAQMHGELASLQKSLGDDRAKTNRKSALDLLKTIDENHKTFIHNTDALYLRATLLEANEEPKAAQEIWRKLANTGSDRYTLHANIVAGDQEFENANPDKAISYYLKAASLLTDLDSNEKGLDELRIYYRLAWANFKGAHHDAAIVAARRAIAPGVLNKSLRQKERVARDIAELVGYALYESDNQSKTREIITSKDFQVLGGTTSLVVIEQYLTANIPQKAEEIAGLAVNRFPLSREYPDILRVKAKAEEKLGKRASRLETLEKLSMLLPKQSLWRTRHQPDIEVTKYMENLASGAAEVVASSYYEEGLSSGNAKKFAMAATHYNILLDEQINSDKAPGLRLKIANCNFFAGNLAAADKGYYELISALKTPDDVLTTAHYQRVLTLEKIWRGNFESVVQKNSDPQKDPSTLAALRQLEQAVDEHANKFPGQSRSVDLLLVAASANRDHNRFDDASKLWQRALLSNPSEGQRSIAVRGLVFAKIRSGKPTDVIESASNFLKLESGTTMGQNLRGELMGVLTTAANEEAANLSKKGNAEDASKILLKISSDFADLPAREQLWRDGAYFAAISGNWAKAQSSAEAYLKGGSNKFSGDMTYLLGRSHEYQLRFGEAVKQYLSLGEKYPNHGRSLAALDRAEKLSTADDNYSSAAKAVKIRADRTKNHAEKLSLQDTAVSYLALAGQFDAAMTIANERKMTSKTTGEKLEAELSVAKVRYQSGDKQTAVDDMDSIALQVERYKFDLGDAYKRLAANVNMALGDHAAAQLKELRLEDSKGDINVQVERKSRLFSEVVTRFDKVASLDQQDLSPKARFILAQSASNFADEISAIPARVGEPTTLKSQARFNQNIARLREMANRYHGNNILAKQRAPQAYAKSEWIGRSALALSDSKNNQRDETRAADQLSTATNSELPQQWSH